jgi:predicted phage gp36 major capsid-like protein
VSETIDQARRLIESRLADIDAEARELERAVASLGGKSTSPRGRRPGKAATDDPRATRDAKRTSRSRRGATKRAARGERRAQLLAAIGATPGARPSELATVIGIRPTQVSVLIAKARSENLVVKSGKGYALKS